MPSGETYDKLAGKISDLSLKYNTPNFLPHITLMGGVEGSQEEGIEKTSKLASLIKPFKVELTYIDYLDYYFQCLFVRCKETRKLIEANERARKVFGRESDPAYMPHLSLIYGDFTHETKNGIVGEIGKQFNISFGVDKIHLYSTNGEVKDWFKIGEFSLG